MVIRVEVYFRLDILLAFLGITFFCMRITPLPKCSSWRIRLPCATHVSYLLKLLKMHAMLLELTRILFLSAKLSKQGSRLPQIQNLFLEQLVRDHGSCLIQPIYFSRNMQPRVQPRRHIFSTRKWTYRPHDYSWFINHKAFGWHPYSNLQTSQNVETFSFRALSYRSGYVYHTTRLFIYPMIKWDKNMNGCFCWSSELHVLKFNIYALRWGPFLYIRGL